MLKFEKSDCSCMICGNKNMESEIEETTVMLTDKINVFKRRKI